MGRARLTFGLISGAVIIVLSLRETLPRDKATILLAVNEMYDSLDSGL